MVDVLPVSNEDNEVHRLTCLGHEASGAGVRPVPLGLHTIVMIALAETTM